MVGRVRAGKDEERTLSQPICPRQRLKSCVRATEGTDNQLFDAQRQDDATETPRRRWEAACASGNVFRAAFHYHHTSFAAPRTAQDRPRLLLHGLSQPGASLAPSNLHSAYKVLRTPALQEAAAP